MIDMDYEKVVGEFPKLAPDPEYQCVFCKRGEIFVTAHTSRLAETYLKDLETTNVINNKINPLLFGCKCCSAYFTLHDILFDALEDTEDNRKQYKYRMSSTGLYMEDVVKLEELIFMLFDKFNIQAKKHREDEAKSSTNYDAALYSFKSLPQELKAHINKSSVWQNYEFAKEYAGYLAQLHDKLFNRRESGK
jgi:hypothetical protein